MRTGAAGLKLVLVGQRPVNYNCIPGRYVDCNLRVRRASVGETFIYWSDRDCNANRTRGR